MSRKGLLVLALLAVMVALVAAPVRGDDIPKGGTVVINESPQGNWPGPNFNPFNSQPRHGTNFMYDPLLIFNPAAGGKATPWLATDVKYGDDLMSVTFTLRDGVKWSDGQPFSVDDVAFTMDLMKQFPALDTGAIWQLLSDKGYEKVGTNQIKFNLKEVYTQADTIIGGMRPVPQHIWKDVKDPVTFLNDKPVATGPFTEVKDFSETVYTICRNPYFWQEGKPYVDCIRYPAFSGNDAVNNAAINGEIDWAGNFIPDITKTYVGKDPEHNGYYFFPSLTGPVLLYFNTTKAPFSDVKFRQAVSMAIDYEGIVNNVYGEGYTTTANPSGLNPGRYPDFVPQAALDKAKEMGIGVYDAEKAAATLEAAGYKAGSDGKRTTPDGKPISFKIQTVNGWTDWTNAAQVIAQNLQDIGLDATIETPEFGAWFSALQTGTFDMSMGWSDYGRTPWTFYRDTFDSSLITKNADGTTTANGTTWPRFTSPELDAALKTFTSTTDLKKQQEAINTIADAYVTNLPSLPLFWNPAWYEYNTTRFVGWPTEQDPYAQGSPWNRDGGMITILSVHCKDATSCGQGK
jgi:peptide/nickel transport system substrate-binding protein